MAIKFEQNPIPGRLLDYTNSLDAELGEVFGEAEKFAINAGLRELVSDEPSRPTLWGHTSKEGKFGYVSVGTKFASQSLKENSMDSISLEIDVNKDISPTQNLHIVVTASCYVYPSNDRHEVIYAQTSHYLDRNGQVTSQDLSITQRILGDNPQGKPIYRGFDIGYVSNQESMRDGDPSIEAMTRDFVSANTTDEDIENNPFIMGATRLILTAQIIPLLEMIASGDAPKLTTPNI